MVGPVECDCGGPPVGDSLQCSGSSGLGGELVDCELVGAKEERLDVGLLGKLASRGSG